MKVLNRLSSCSFTKQTRLFHTFHYQPLTKTHTSLYHHFEYTFSKTKKVKTEAAATTAQLQTPTIHIRHFSEEHDGFLLYQNMEGNRIRMLSIAFVVCFISAFWSYKQTDDDEIKVNFMIMGGLMAIPFLIFQFRTAKTLKRLVLDKNGENVILSRFALGGFGQESTKAKVEVLRGIGKAFVFGGSVIKGGGVYGLEERNYWFQSKYIRERDIFEQVTAGHRIKIDKSKAFE